MKIILTEEQFKRVILKEDIMDCPTGFVYDKEVDNCVEVQELDSVTVLTFRDPNTQKTYDNYRDLYYDISKEFNKSGKELDEKFNVDNYDKLDNDFLIKLTNDLKNLYEKEKDSLSVNWVKNNIDTHIGKPYIWGDEGPESFDCSGFIDYTLSLGRETANGYYEKYKDLSIDDENVRVGDLIFFDTVPANVDRDGRPIDHIGIVTDVSNRKKIEFTHASGGQCCSNLSKCKGENDKQRLKNQNKKKISSCQVKKNIKKNYWKRKFAGYGRTK